MRLDDYDFVFEGWAPEGRKLVKTGWQRLYRNGLPYVEFHATTDAGTATVLCDPCSLDQDRGAYLVMVRFDLMKALRRIASADA